MFNKNDLRFNFFSKIFLFFLSITIFLLAISIISTQYYLHFLQKIIEDRTLKNLNILGERIDSVLLETFNQASGFMWTDELEKIRKSKNPIKDFSKGNPSLGRQAKSFLYSIYYIDNKNGIVIDKHNIENIDIFFNFHYPLIKFKDIVYLPINEFTSLPKLTQFNENYLSYTNVMPFFLIDEKNPGNLLLINISEEKFFQLLKTFTVNSNTHLFIMDSNGNIRSHTYRENIYTPLLYKPIKDIGFLYQIKKGKPFYSNYFGEKRLIIHYESKKSTSQKLYYVSAIPFTELYNQSIPFSIITLLISLLSLVFALLLAFFMSKNLYNPVKKLLSLFIPFNNQTIKKAENEFSLITQNVKKLIIEKKRLRKNLIKTIPMATENYLFKILNDNNIIIENKFNEFLKSNNILFNNPFFVVVIIMLNWTNNFYEKYDREKQISLLNETYKLLKNTFYSKYRSYILNMDKNEFCLIINLKDKNIYRPIIKYLKKIHNIYKLKQNYIDSYFGVGRIHKGIAGLKKSYNEALNAVSSISPISPYKINIFKPNVSNDILYSYSINEENQLLNLLITGLNKEVINLYNTIIKNNTQKNISITAQKDLYIHIYHTCIRALTRLEISPKQLMGNAYIDILTEYKKISIETLNNYLISIFEKIALIPKIRQSSKIKINSIINYINKNFNKDIYLEGIANDYKISVSHLSRILKNSFGMPFQNHINNQRIKMAKMILKDTDKKIEEISKECGFNSRFTFIKMFKKIEGITPTQYRTTINEKLIKNYFS